MDDTPITLDDDQATGAADTAAQPDTTDDMGAANEPTEPTNTAEAEESAEATEEPSTDENLEWLKNKGIDPTSPEAITELAKMARNAEKKMHESTAKASELQKELSSPQQAANDNPNDALAAEVQSLKMAYAVKDFFDGNPDAKALEQKMASMVTDRPEIGQLVRAGYLSVSDLYHLAKGGDPALEAEAKTQGGKEALEQLAKKQQAKALTGSATTSELSDTTKEDPFLKAFDAN